MAPRRREQTSPLPHGIKPDALPAYVYFDRTGRGRWIYQRYDPVRKRKASMRLAGPEATLKEIWEAFEAITRQPPAKTIRTLIERFEASPAWADLAENTKRDYRGCAKAILEAKTKAGALVADTRLDDWTPGSVRSYVDQRAKTSRTRANHELRYLRRLFAWAAERDMMASNPARGVKTLKEAPRQRYVGEQEYADFLAFAGARYPYLIPVAELAYLCRLRLSEVCDLRREHVLADGLFAKRRKGSKDGLTEWTPRLRAAVDAALAIQGTADSPFLISGHSGGRMGESTVQTAWQRSMKLWEQLPGNERFTIHDLKRAGVSDAEGDKLAASGHRSQAMLRVYDVLPARAPATR